MGQAGDRTGVGVAGPEAAQPVDPAAVAAREEVNHDVAAFVDVLSGSMTEAELGSTTD